MKTALTCKGGGYYNTRRWPGCPPGGIPGRFFIENHCKSLPTGSKQTGTEYRGRSEYNEEDHYNTSYYGDGARFSSNCGESGEGGSGEGGSGEGGSTGGDPEAIAASEYPVLPLYYKANTMLMHNNVQGYFVTPSNDLLLKTAYIAE